MAAFVRIALAVAMVGAPVAAAPVLGSDAATCTANAGPAIQATITGLKDRKGALTLELYPANEVDFLARDVVLAAEGKVFRRVVVATPATGPATLCIRTPGAGTYALLFTHDRDRKPKFNFFSDGAGIPGNVKLGRARPKVGVATIAVGSGVVAIEIRAQYLRGLGGFGPLRG